MAAAGKMPAIYDGIHHRDGTHAFFVQGSAAHYLGHGASNAPFLDVDTQQVWAGYSKYQFDGAATKSQEAFAYSCCYAGALLVAVHLAPAAASVKEWVILHVDLSEVPLVAGGCDGFFESKSVEVGAKERDSLLQQIRPGQRMEVAVGWKEDAQCFSIEHVELKWDDCQSRCLSDFGLSRRTPWSEKVEIALTGRSHAFPNLGVCKIQNSMVVQKRTIWKFCRKENPEPYAVQLTFVAFCQFDQWPGKILHLRVRHTYNPVPGQSLLWDLAPDDRVRGSLHAEWDQVGSIRHHVLSVAEKVDPRCFAPLPATRLGDAANLQLDLFEGGSGRWVELWRTEDLKEDLNLQRHWGEHVCSTSDAIQILDDDDVDVASIIEGTLLGMQKPAKSRVKSEVLKERLKEQETRSRVVQRVQVTPEFLDPYAEVCQEQLSRLKDAEKPVEKVEETPKAEKCEGDSTRGKRTRDGEWHGCSWNWKGSSSWNSRNWEAGDWKKSRARATPPPPPPPPPAAPTCSPCCPGTFRHLTRAVPHVYGEAASDVRLKPLVDLRRMLETHGISGVGELEMFQERMSGIVWDCLPHLRDDGSFGRMLEEGLRDCGIHPLQTYGFSLEALASFSRADVQTVFNGFSPAPVRLRSADFATLSAVPLESAAVERLAAWAWWLSALEQPHVELFKSCLKELPSSWVHNTYSDSYGYHMPMMLRWSDLHRFSEGDADLAGCCFLEPFKQGVQQLISATFDASSTWWSTAMLTACRWSVEHMHLPQGRVDLEELGKYFQLLNGVSRQFRREALDLILRIQDVEKSRQMPRSFDLGKVDVRHSEHATIPVLAASKWPFE
jgi:hypothetical protein